MGDEPAIVTSRRVTAARSRAELRAARQRVWVRPFGLAILAIVAVGTFNGHPHPAVRGEGLAVVIALAVFVAGLAVTLRPSFAQLPPVAQALAIGAIGGAGVALSGLQPHDTTGLAPSAAVFFAVARLALPLGLALGGAVTAGLDIVLGVRGNSGTTVLASTLLCLMLGLIAYFLKESRFSQAQTELLMAELEDARDAQAEAAALAERARIAGDLHDVLAHSLSGAAIQLQGARLMAEREGADVQVRDAIERAGDLVRDGLAEARRAVSALRGDGLPGVDQLAALVESFRSDMDVDAVLRVEGSARPLAAQASSVLYRGAQEALTNVARYAPGAKAAVVLTYGGGRVSLSVEDRVAPGAATGDGLEGLGGGHGLAAMRERVEQLGGALEAGPTGDGWRVCLEVPA